MAFACKYRGEFYDLSFSASTQGLLWTVEIEEDAYTGSVTDMKMGGQPLVIEHMAVSDNLLFDPIKGSRATINIWSETHFQYTSLYSSENFKYRVSIYYGDAKTLYWRGYLTTEYTEPYDDTPYEVSITASDGLGLLKDMPYKYTTTEKNDTYYSGRRYESQVILDILGKLGHTAFNEYCNIYEDNLNDDNDDSVFDQVLIDMDVFRDMNCYDVLSEVLKKYNAVIRQSRGVFWIYRPIEQLGDAFARLFTAYNTKTDDEFTPLKYIHRTAYASTLKDFTGGTLMLQPPLAQFTAEQDYGAKESWIKDYNFDTSTWNTDDPANYHYDNWTHSGIIQPLSYDLPKELQGVEIMPDGSGTNYYIYQDFATYAKASSDVMIFAFDWRLIKRTATAASNVTVKVQLRAVEDDYWLNDAADDITATWETSNHYVEFVVATVAAYSLGEWATAEYQISTGLPVDGPYRITLYATDTAQVRVAFKNVRFYATNDTVSVKTHQKSNIRRLADAFTGVFQQNYFKGFAQPYLKYKYSLTTNEIIDKDEIVLRTYLTPDPQTIEAPTTGQSYILGDCEDTNLVNVIEHFAGSLGYYVTGSLKRTAENFALANYSDYLAGGVIVSALNGKVIFTSSVAGTNFTGSTTITNVSGTLDGTVENTVANVAGQTQIETVTLSGSSGSININIIEQVFPLDFNTSLNQTAADFVTNYADYLAGYNITVTNSGADVVFTETSAQGGFDAPTITKYSGDLDGSVAHTQASQTPTARIDTVTLTGTSGTANILCDGTTHLATFDTGTVLEYTSSWHTRDNTEGRPLIELMADEIAALHVRERHFIQANLRETSVTEPDLNVIHGIRDTLNTYAGTARTFSINRGTFDVKLREWQIDLHEICKGVTGYYYIATTGSDSTGDGSYTNPWKTLYYAATQVTTAGTMIYVTPGTYTETTQTALAVGVSITGAGDTSIITSSAALNPIILLSSASQGTDGDQTISHLKLDGNSTTATSAIKTVARSNIKIYNCTFEDFLEYAVIIEGSTSGPDDQPSTYASGIEFHDNTTDNCANYSGSGTSALRHSGTDGMLIYNNTMTQTSRAAGSNGYLIKGRYNKATQIYDNTFTRTVDNQPYHFLVEYWDCDGGCKVYQNTFIGGALDIGGYYSHKGAYAYSYDVYQNTFKLNSSGTLNSVDYPVWAVVVEGGAEDVIVRRNLMQNFNYPIAISVLQADTTMQRVYFYYNIVHNWGNTATGHGAAVQVAGDEDNGTMQYIYFYNNVFFDDGTDPDPYYVVWFNATGGTFKYWEFKNNIFVGGADFFFRTQSNSGTPSFDYLTITYNIQYGNGYSNEPYYDASFTPTHITYSNSVKSDPSFVGGSPYSFELNTGSPCINAGTDVDLTEDYSGEPVAATPEIGAYEYN